MSGSPLFPTNYNKSSKIEKRLLIRKENKPKVLVIDDLIYAVLEINSQSKEGFRMQYNAHFHFTPTFIQNQSRLMITEQNCYFFDYSATLYAYSVPSST